MMVRVVFYFCRFWPMTLEADPLLNSQLVVEEFLDAWISGDISATVALLAPDATYSLHVSEDLLPFAGVSTGRESIRARLTAMREAWDYEMFEPGPVRVDPNDETVVRCSVSFMFRYRATGDRLRGRFRTVWHVQDGLVESCEEYHDRPRVEAFLRLLGLPHHGVPPCRGFDVASGPGVPSLPGTSSRSTSSGSGEI